MATARLFRFWRCLLVFLAYYLVVGGVWYVLEESVSPIAGAIAGCVLTPIVYWIGTKLSLMRARPANAIAFGMCSILIVIIVDVVLWVEPIGWVSKLVNISFNFEQFYLERYSVLLLLVYLEILVTPLACVWFLQKRRPRPQP